MPGFVSIPDPITSQMMAIKALLHHKTSMKTIACLYVKHVSWSGGKEKEVKLSPAATFDEEPVSISLSGPSKTSPSTTGEKAFLVKAISSSTWLLILRSLAHYITWMGINM